MSLLKVGDMVATWRGSGRVVALMLRWRGPTGADIHRYLVEHSCAMCVYTVWYEFDELHLPVPGFVTLVPPVPAKTLWDHLEAG